MSLPCNQYSRREDAALAIQVARELLVSGRPVEARAAIQMAAQKSRIPVIATAADLLLMKDYSGAQTALDVAATELAIPAADLLPRLQRVQGTKALAHGGSVN